MSFFTEDEVKRIGFATLGERVLVSRLASIHSPERIELGNDIRIDDFCLLSAGHDGVFIGNNVHLGAYTGVWGAARIEFHDFSGVSSRVSIYSSSDDFSGAAMTGPTIAEEFRSVESSPVVLHRHALVGVGAVLLPGTRMLEGSCLGALSVANGTLKEFTVYTGSPARVMAPRSRHVLDVESSWRETNTQRDHQS